MKQKNYTVIIIIGVILVVVALIIGWGSGSYNKFVALQEEVKTKESAVDVTLERRADLIPNLVNTVKGYVSHEEAVIEQITSARENLLNADDIEEKSEANNELTNAISALMVIVENYPDLKANTNFINLQDELAGTENRISVARQDYNDAAKKYNTAIKSFPNNLIAEMFDFDDVDYFEVSAGKTEVPEVNFE